MVIRLKIVLEVYNDKKQIYCAARGLKDLLKYKSQGNGKCEVCHSYAKGCPVQITVVYILYYANMSVFYQF